MGWASSVGPNGNPSGHPAPSAEPRDEPSPPTATPAKRARGPVSELTQRWVFGLLAAPATVALIWIGGVPMALLLSATAGVAAWELFRMARTTGALPLAGLGIGAAALLPLYMVTEPRGVFEFPPALLAGIVVVVLSAAIWLRGTVGRPLSSVATTIFGIGYTGGLLSFAQGIRYHRYVVTEMGGAALLLLPVLLTWANDIGAFFSGRLLGRRKLIPAVSPGKTVAGAIGGLVACLILCWLYVQFVLRPFAQLSLSPRNLVAFAVVVSAAGQLGDLAESLLKREAGVKNSSGIFPGHGGVLDRIDSLLFVLPVAWVLFSIPGLLLPVP
jgi:phosphatidate cytidylyltransferase